MLALACAESGRLQAAEAWVDWQEREQAQIQAAGRLLGRHYFGREDLAPPVVSGAIGLQPKLALAPETLAAACASLAEALAQPRYDLARRHADILEALQRDDSRARPKAAK